MSTEETSPLATHPAQPPKPRVGFIGVGNMGSAMVERLLTLGYRVAVHDTDAQREAQAVSLGAMACATPAGVASSSDVLILTVVDAVQTQAALFGPHGGVAALAPGAAVLLCSTLAPAETERIALDLQQRGVDCLDAPMSGSPERARDGNISLMLACPQEVLERHRRLIEALSSRVFLISEHPGDATRTQLVNTLLAGINLAGAAEALALAERMGLSVARTLEVMEQSSGHSWIGTDRMRRAIRGDYMPRAHTRLMRDDTAAALAMAHEAGVQTPLAAQASALFARACDQGLATLDDGSVFELLRRR